jgi:hypothetical protein
MWRLWFVIFLLLNMHAALVTICPAQIPERIPVDQEKCLAHGIRKIAGKHIDLYTDMPVSDDVEEMTEIFDLAVPQWCDYFQVDQAKAADWKINGFLMVDQQKFADAGLVPERLPQFLNGYQQGYQFWLFEQPSSFFRRHLFLHEGTHAFMNLLLGGSGPAWYTEGMAELLGCHQWKDGSLKIGYLIRSRDESPYWGRVKAIQDAVAAETMPDLRQVLKLKNRAFLNTEPYAWVWAACSFFDGHPDYQEKFRLLKSNVADRSDGFTDQFLQDLNADWDRLQEQWQLYLTEMDYGLDVAHVVVKYQDVHAIPEKGELLKINANQSWQSSGLRVAAGQKLLIRSQGRYVVGQTDQPWECEPQGITIHYYRGMPLGALTMAVRDESQPLDQLTPLAKPLSVGRSLEQKFETDGTIFFRINESPVDLGDNQGILDIHVMPVK